MKKFTSILCALFLAIGFLPLSVLQAQNDLPRVMVVVDEKIDDKDVTARKVAGKIESMLLSKGYRLVDSKQFEAVKVRDLSLGDLNATKAKELGRRYGAELIIAGGAQAMFGGEVETYGIKNQKYSADGEIKVVNMDTGEIIAVATATSTKSSQNKSQAASKSLEEIGVMMANDIGAKLDAKMKEASEKPIIVELILQGVNDATVVKFEQELPSKISMIKKMKLRYMEGDAASFDVTLHGTLDELRKQCSSMPELSVTGFSGNRLDVNTKTTGVKKASMIMSSSLEINEFKVENIFPSQIAYYAKNPIGKVTLENTGKADIKNIKAKIFIPTYMQMASEQNIPLLKAGTKQTFDVSATLDRDKLFGVNENTISQIKAEITYTLGAEEKTRSITKPITMYSKNSISWSRPNSAGAFITYKDEAVENFSRAVIGNVQCDMNLLPGASRNQINAMKVWDAVRAFSINYVSDPWIVAEGDVLDEIQFPRETLAKKAGDCDDSSILLAACLENIGVHTALLGTTDHVFIMFDTGVNKKNASRISLNEREYVIRENTVWIPLETTIINKATFAEAWAVGAEGYYKTADAKGKLDIVDVRKSWETYPPTNLALQVKVAETPSPDVIGALLNSDLKNLAQVAAQRLDEKVTVLKKANNEKSSNEAAMLLANAGRFDDALVTLKAYTSAAAQNNIGNVYLLKGDSLNAYRSYTGALQADAKDGGIELNMGLLQYLGGDHEGTVTSFANAVSKFPSQEKAYAELGIDNIVAEMSQTKAAERGTMIDRGELHNLLFAALKDLSAKKDVRAASATIRRGENKFVFGGRRGIDPTQLSSLKDFLYWKM